MYFKRWRGSLTKKHVFVTFFWVPHNFSKMLYAITGIGSKACKKISCFISYFIRKSSKSTTMIFKHWNLFYTISSIRTRLLYHNFQRNLLWVKQICCKCAALLMIRQIPLYKSLILFIILNWYTFSDFRYWPSVKSHCCHFSFSSTATELCFSILGIEEEKYYAKMSVSEIFIKAF